MQKEIEVKIKIDAKQMVNLQKWLSVNAQDLGTMEITDYYLNHPQYTFFTASKMGYKDPLEFLRVRKTQVKDYICYKKRSVDEDGNTVQVEELDLEIGGGADFLYFFKKLGFAEEFIIKKERHIYLYEREFEVAIDVIKNLGTFVEVEIKGFDGGVQDGIKKIYNFLKRIGIKKFISFDRGYLCIVLNPKYDFGKKVTL